MTSQMRAILRDLDRHRRAFDLTDANLGADLLELTAAGILRRMDAELDPDLARWPELSPAYARYKRRTRGPLPMAVLDKAMKQIGELRGKQSVAPDQAEMEYGVSADAIDHAEKFQEGNPPNQPARPFYYFDTLIEAEADALLDARFARIVR